MKRGEKLFLSFKLNWMLRETNLWRPEGRISGMPDEVLVSILSLVTVNEAASTGVRPSSPMGKAVDFDS
jgi:hypothetical protein